MKQELDIALNTAYDLSFSDGDFSTDNSLIQEVDLIVGMSQGELKEDPLLGPNLMQLINSRVNLVEFQSRVKLHLARDGKNYEEIKELVNQRLKTN